MAWTPKRNVIDTSQLNKNIIAHFEANQIDALAWAKGDNSLQKIKKFYKRANGIVNTVFPSLVTLEKAVDDSLGDYLGGAFAVTYQVYLQGGDADKVSSDADYYCEALRSMLANIPTEIVADTSEKLTLTKNSKIQIAAQIVSLESEFDELLGNGKNKFLQAFKIRAVYSLVAAP